MNLMSTHIPYFGQNLTSIKAGPDIAYAGELSVWRQFSFNCHILAFSLKNSFQDNKENIYSRFSDTIDLLIDFKAFCLHKGRASAFELKYCFEFKILFKFFDLFLTVFFFIGVNIWKRDDVTLLLSDNIVWNGTRLQFSLQNCHQILHKNCISSDGLEKCLKKLKHILT